MNLRVAFIDDGINRTRLSIKMPVSNIMITDNGVVDVEEADINPCSHGTICAAIFSKYVHLKNIELICIKVLDSNLKGKVQSLISAMEWCIKNNISIINCSLGTTNDNDFRLFSDVLSNIKKQKITIVAAMSNKDIYTYPACSNDVIGVRNNNVYTNGCIKLRWYPFDDVEIETSGAHELLLNDNGIFKTIHANSFSTPVVTAMITDIIGESGKMSNIEILKYLEIKATTVIGNCLFSESPYPWNQNEKIVGKKYYEQIIKRYIHNYIVHDMVPIIKIYGENLENEIKAIKALEFVLVNNNINYYVMSDYYDEMQLKYIFVPIDIDSNILARNIYRKFKCQIIIAHSSKIDADISVFVTLEDVKILCDDKSTCFLCGDESSYVRVMDYIYQVLL